MDFTWWALAMTLLVIWLSAEIFREAAKECKLSPLRFAHAWLTNTLPREAEEQEVKVFLVFKRKDPEGDFEIPDSWTALGVTLSGARVHRPELFSLACEWSSYSLQEGDHILTIGGKAFDPSRASLTRYVGENGPVEKLCCECLVRRWVEPAQWPLLSAVGARIAQSHILTMTPESEEEMESVVVAFRHASEHREDNEQAMKEQMERNKGLGLGIGGMMGGLAGGLAGGGMSDLSGSRSSKRAPETDEVADTKRRLAEVEAAEGERRLAEAERRAAEAEKRAAEAEKRAAEALRKAPVAAAE